MCSEDLYLESSVQVADGGNPPGVPLQNVGLNAKLGQRQAIGAGLRASIFTQLELQCTQH